MTPETFTIRDQTYQVASWPQRIAAKVIDFVFSYGCIGGAAAVLHMLLPELLANALMMIFFFLGFWWWLASDGILYGSGVGPYPVSHGSCSRRTETPVAERRSPRQLPLEQIRAQGPAVVQGPVLSV